MDDTPQQFAPLLQTQRETRPTLRDIMITGVCALSFVAYLLLSHGLRNHFSFLLDTFQKTLDLVR